MSWFNFLNDTDMKFIDKTYLKKSEFNAIIQKALSNILEEAAKLQNVDAKNEPAEVPNNPPSPEPKLVSWDESIKIFFDVLKKSLKAQGGRFRDEAAALNKVKELKPTPNMTPVLTKFTADDISTICTLMDMMQSAVLPFVTRA